MKLRPIQFVLLVLALLAVSASALAGPVLEIPDAIPAELGEPVSVPVLFTRDGAAISAVLFSVDFDQECLHFDPADADFDGLPDDVVFLLPNQFTGSVAFDPQDLDGELDFVVADFGPPLAALTDGVVAFVIFTPTCPSRQATVAFSQEPAPSFGDTQGQGVEGMSFDGSVVIGEWIFSDGFESGDLSAWTRN